MSAEHLLLAVLAIPTLGTPVIAATGFRPNLREGVTLVTAGLLFLANLALLNVVLGGGRPDVTLIEIVPGMPIRFTIEPLGMLFALVASGLWIVNSIYSIGYMRANREGHQTRFYVCFAIAIASTMGVALAGNMMTLFIAYEVLTLSTYPLVVHHGDAEARAGGRLYVGILLSTSIGLQLLAIVWTWIATGTLDFRPGGILAGQVSAPVAGILLFLYMYGIGKAALMPLHRWLPAAMVAPAPVSALLHAVAVVKAGVFTVVKVLVYVFGIDFLAGTGQNEWLIVIAGITVIGASLIALTKDNLKARLAYSTVSQLGYVVLAAAVLTPISITGAVMHIAAHAVSKITLFFAAGSVYTAAHLTEVSQLDGIGRRMPWTMGAFAVGALSMIGVPPTAGFLGKWFMLVSAMETSRWFVVAVLVLSTILNAAYFLPIVAAAFFRPPGKDVSRHAHGEAPLPIVIALTATAALTLTLFFAPQVPLALARMLTGG